MSGLLGAYIPLPHRVRHHRRLDEGGDGPTWAEPVEVAARIEVVQKHQQLPDGRVVMLAARVYLPGEVEVRVGDRLEWNGRARPVEVVESPTWWDGTVMHHEVMTT